MSADPRSRTQRRGDTERRLTQDIDVWVASAAADGAPYRWFRISPRRIQAWPGDAEGDREGGPV